MMPTGSTSEAAGSSAEPATPTRVVQGGRAKAYRPMPVAERAAAVRAALEAYDRGDFFLAHELLEPAWMGTADPVERDLYQGLIKLAAGFVHAVRGNPSGVVANLRGARDRLARAAAGEQERDERSEGPDSGDWTDGWVGLDVGSLLAQVEESLALAETLAGRSTIRGPRRAGEPARRPVPIEPPAIAWSVR